MYRTILVPLDGTQRAEAILPQVEALARLCGTRVLFLRVLEPAPALARPASVYTTWSAETQAQQSDAATIYLAGKRGEFRELGLPACTCLETGPVVETILRVAARSDVDLIAMASHGRTALEQLGTRSVAAGVLHGSHGPLLLVRSCD